MKLNDNKTRGTMTDTPVCFTRSTEDIIADQLVSGHMSVAQLRRTISAVADEMYRPPWR